MPGILYFKIIKKEIKSNRIGDKAGKDTQQETLIIAMRTRHFSSILNQFCWLANVGLESVHCVLRCKILVVTWDVVHNV